MLAQFESDPQFGVARFRSLDDFYTVGEIQDYRFFHEHVLADLQSQDCVRCMKVIPVGYIHGINPGIAQNRINGVVTNLGVMLGSKFFCSGGISTHHGDKFAVIRQIQRRGNLFIRKTTGP